MLNNESKGWCRVLCGSVVVVLCATGTLAGDRSYDGSGNNETNPDWGKAGIQQRRVTTPSYDDGLSAPADDGRPNPRDISNIVARQTHSVPEPRGLSSFVWAWGQFVDHDISLTPAFKPAQPYNIAVPAGDLDFDPTNLGTVKISLDRSIYDTATGITDPRQQRNMISSWLDGSVVYGSDKDRADDLRTFVDGKLKTSAGNLLPFNTVGQDNASLPGQLAKDLFLAGDERANENVVLISMHTLFVREHNRLAEQIMQDNTGWIDEQIYQHARKLVGAEIAAITYNEFLPALGIQLDPYTTYKDDVNGSIANIFSTAAYRVGHSMLTPTLARIDHWGNEIGAKHLALQDAYFVPQEVVDTGIDSVLRGLAASSQQMIDTYVIDDVRNLLFGPPGSGGKDLTSLNIQRGRDHGLPDYNQLRLDMLMSPVSEFWQITSDPIVAAALEEAYGSVDLIDAWVGMLAEDPMAGSSLGPMLTRILAEQFTALRDGDWYYYENDSDLSSELTQQLAATELSDVIMHNTYISRIQDNVFFADPIPEPATALLSALACCALWTVTARRARR